MTEKFIKKAKDAAREPTDAAWLAFARLPITSKPMTSEQRQKLNRGLEQVRAGAFVTAPFPTDDGSK